MAASTNLNFVSLFVILVLAATVCPGISDREWSGCAHYRGYCRETCFPQEKSLGPQGCPEGEVCCLSGAWEGIWAP